MHSPRVTPASLKFARYVISPVARLGGTLIAALIAWLTAAVIAFPAIALPVLAASVLILAVTPAPAPDHPISRAMVEAISPEIAEALRRREFAIGAPIADAEVPRAIADPAFELVLREVRAEFCARPSSARILNCLDARSRSGAH